MMNKKKTNNSMRVKYVLYVPMIVMLLIVSNIDSIARSVTNVTVDNKVAPVSVLQKQKSQITSRKSILWYQRCQSLMVISTSGWRRISSIRQKQARSISKEQL